jgi:hypothetical protein
MIHDDTTHFLCIHCWHDWAPTRAPDRVAGATNRECCRCGLATTAGAYVSAEPDAWGRCLS